MDLLRPVHVLPHWDKLLIKLSISPSPSVLTPGQLVPALTLFLQAPGSVATGVQLFKSLIWFNLEQHPEQKKSANIKSLKGKYFVDWVTEGVKPENITQHSVSIFLNSDFEEKMVN